ncbi:MAG: mandelate racemase/muconate lactonizing enzyme family protein [Actinomycetota bacterium]
MSVTDASSPESSPSDGLAITAIETRHCDAGWRNYHFVKVSTADGVVGWSEYDEGFGSPGVTAVIDALAPRVVGRSAMAHERIHTELFAATRPGAGSVVGQGLGAIENALLDAKAKALGVPVYDLLGGRQRDRIRVYWSHCGTWRIAQHRFYGNRITDLAGVRALGEEVRERGFTALKTNIFTEWEGVLRSWAPGFGRPWSPGLNAEPLVLRGLYDVLAAFRDGAGPEVGILLDLNFNLRTAGVIEVLRALADFELFWVEYDNDSPDALRVIRDRAHTQVASLETKIGLPAFVPYFGAQAVDVAIVDTIWNGTWQSMKIAAAAQAHEIQVAPHNFYGHLSTMMSAHFAAAVPHLRIMETDIDRLPWDADLFTEVPEYVDGHLVVPDRPGWGTEPDEAALAAHPPGDGPGFLVSGRGRQP